jgi:hypothetical protein
MIMTSAVEARIHAVAPESIAIHFTCKQDFCFAPVRSGWFLTGAIWIVKGFRYEIKLHGCAIRDLFPASMVIIIISITLSDPSSSFANCRKELSFLYI